MDKTEPGLRNIKLKDRQKGFIDFKRQKGRSKFYKMQTRGNPHPKRFISFNAFPQASTKARKIVTANMKRSMGRDDKKYQINLTPSVFEPHSEDVR
mmetsp:Transcript_8855/g.10030  ORF Transcript_8855/g.10030 Transcript_8855/m.10030 type:complete len:96 (+) Transcript_8855:146-433(+)